MQRRLFQAIDEVILVVLLSNERMFKGLLLDLGPLERDTEVNRDYCEKKEKNPLITNHLSHLSKI